MDCSTQMAKDGVCEKTSQRKGSWSPEEDEKLIAYINRYGIWNWNQMPKPAGLSRSGKSCRLRWMNYLRPGVKRGNFSQEEDEIIFKLHEELGNRWSTIASRLPGRTDNEIKNYWHTRLNKRLENNRLLSRKATTENNKKNSSEADFLLPNSPKESNKAGYKAAPMFSPLSTDDFSSSSYETSSEIFESQPKFENIGSSETYGQLQSSIKTTFPTLESFDMVEGYGIADPGFRVPTSEGVISGKQTLPMEDSDMAEAFGPTDPGFRVSNSCVGFPDEQLQRLLEQPFPEEASLEMLEGYGPTDPGFMTSTSYVCGLQEFAYPCASYYDGGNDFWPYFLMES